MLVVAFIDWSLFNLLRLTSHSALISCDISTLDEDAVSWNLHTRFNLNDISNNEFLVVNGLSETFESSEDCDVLIRSLGN